MFELTLVLPLVDVERRDTERLRLMSTGWEVEVLRLWRVVDAALCCEA